MRKHGWQLPYHPLQVVAVSVFVALGFGFYVFFVPFVGKQMYEFILMGIYTPFLICSVGLYIWCAAADPADPGVFRSKKYINILENMNYSNDGEKGSNKEKLSIKSGTNSITEPKKKNSTYRHSNWFVCLLALLPCAYACDSNNESSDQGSEDGMFYCSLCQVEVCKHSKHCRVCNKCVDHFDHHCRWLNNCIGKRNYRKFFTLMVSALILLVLQWSTGILVLILCFLERKQFAADISSKLGSSFTMVPFVIVVAACTILAMIATLPLVQLFFFHILLIKKGISTYDYIIALREQEPQGGGGDDRQSAQMSPVSSFTGLSSVSSFNTFNRGSWCTPPRLFVENQFDVLAPDNVSVNSLGKRMTADEHFKKKSLPPTVKISPWTLARLNAEEVTRAAAEARKKSKILRPITKHQHESGNSFRSSHGTRMIDDNRQQTCLPVEPLSKLPNIEPKVGTSNSTGFLGGIVPSSPDSSLASESPELQPLGVSSATTTAQRGEGPLSRSTSDGYDASGGEDSDWVSMRIVHRASDWRSLLMDGLDGKLRAMERRRH